MKHLARFVIISVAIFSLNYNYLWANPNSDQDTCEVLLIGSSYFNSNNLTTMIKSLAHDSDIELYIEMWGQSGSYLADHANNPETEAKINERDWDYVILQGVGVLVAYPDYFTDHPVYPALETLKEKIYANCESTRMIFGMPWAFEDGMTWYQDWTDDFEQMQLHVYDNTLLYSDEIGFEIAPIGWAWYAVLEEYGYPLHYLHLDDWNHPSLRGSYLMACVIFSTVFQESTVGNNYHAGLPSDEAEFFQAVASDTVLNNLELWNITPLVTNIPSYSTSEEFYLYQNFPNPVTSNTTICYSLVKDLKVRVIITDVLGRSMTELVDQKQKQGTYYIELDASGLKSGIYYYKIIADQVSQTKIMIVGN